MRDVRQALGCAAPAVNATAKCQERVTASFSSLAFIIRPGLRWPIPPSTSPEDPGFQPPDYYRGPIWLYSNPGPLLLT